MYVTDWVLDVFLGRQSSAGHRLRHQSVVWRAGLTNRPLHNNRRAEITFFHSGSWTPSACCSNDVLVTLYLASFTLTSWKTTSRCKGRGRRQLWRFQWRLFISRAAFQWRLHLYRTFVGTPSLKPGGGNRGTWKNLLNVAERVGLSSGGFWLAYLPYCLPEKLRE